MFILEQNFHFFFFYCFTQENDVIMKKGLHRLHHVLYFVLYSICQPFLGASALALSLLFILHFVCLSCYVYIIFPFLTTWLTITMTRCSVHSFVFMVVFPLAVFNPASSCHIHAISIFTYIFFIVLILSVCVGVPLSLTHIHTTF